MRSLSTLAVLALALLVPLSASAEETLACQYMGDGLAESYLNPPVGGDQDFFVTHGGIPNVLFILDTSASMRDLPFWPATDGCGDTRFNSLGFVADPASPYPAYDPDNKDAAFERRDDRVYTFDVTNPTVFDNTHIDVTDVGACNKLSYDGIKKGQCQQCITKSGYYRDGNIVLTSGNFLNYFPPKYVMARKSLKRVLEEVREIRMGILGLDDPGAFWITSQGLNPACDLATDVNTGKRKSNFDSNRKSMINAIDNLTLPNFEGWAPMGEALLQAGQFHTLGGAEYEASLPGYSTNVLNDRDFDGATSQNQQTICWSCQFNNVILIGGTSPCGDQQMPDAIKNLDASVDPRLNCPDCGYETCRWPITAYPQHLHKVAWYLNNAVDHRSDLPDRQSVYTYAVGFRQGDSVLLRKTAELGGGQYRVAQNEDDLVTAVKDLLDIISDRANAFVSSSFATVQTQATQSILVPRFRPSRQLPWEGHLYRYDFVSEFVADVDLDQDGDKKSFFLIGRGCASVTDWSSLPSTCKPLRSAERADLDANPELRLGDLYRTASFSDTTLTAVPGEPFWDAAQELDDMGPSERHIYTALPDAEGNWSKVAFTEANADLLLPYLGLDRGPFCDDILGYAGLGLSSGLTRTDCARMLIRYVRGCAAGDPRSTCTQRPRLLADIFHSSPVIMEPPTKRQLLKTPFRHQQSMVTLALDTGLDPVPIERVTSGEEVLYPHPYDKFAADQAHRDRITLAGSNGGMLHAFHTGAWDDTNNQWTRGTGEEIWAFIPPNLLPKLRLFLTQIDHQVFVDGSAWVRNVWVDGLGVAADKDGVRQWNEYRTVAIVGEREGGARYFALDITHADRDTNGNKLTADGSGEPDLKFLWSFPGEDSPVAAAMGQSWSDVTPHAPPIGPIRLATERTGAPTYRDTPFEERWIAAIPGGYDPLQARGRGWAFVDAYTGEEIWKVHYQTSGVRSHMTHSFGAPPALTAWGTETRLKGDQFWFDTMVIGDTGGQLWVARFNHPDPTKWTVARMFEEEKSGGASQAPWRNPFFQVPALIPLTESGLLRVYVGSGDRAHLREQGGGVCSAHNLTACLREGCTIGTATHQRTYDATTSSLAWSYPSTSTGWSNGGFYSVAPGDACNGLDVSESLEVTCGSRTSTISAGLNCADDTTTGWDCDATRKDAAEIPIECPGSSSSWVDSTWQSNWPKDRMYSIRVFGGDQTPSRLETAPADFDSARLTTGTSAQTDVVDADSGSVGPMSPGWYYEYPVLHERTSSPALTSAACVVWTSMETNPANLASDPSGGCTTNKALNDSSPCESSGRQTAWMYFRDFVSGRPGCIRPEPDDPDWDDGNDRQLMGTKPQPPPPPQIVVQVGPQGATQVSVVTAEGGDVSLGLGDDILQEFGTIEVSPELHEWRHAACEDASGTWVCE